MEQRLNPGDTRTGTGERSSSGSGLARLLTAVFNQWKQAGIPFVVLRNYENLPASTSNDVDVLIEPGRLPEAERVLVTAAQSAGYRLHNRIEFASLLLLFYDPETLHQVQIDLYGGVPWRGFSTLPARSVIEEKVDRGLFAVPHPVHEAVISLLGRLLQHGMVGDKYKPRIVAGFKSDPAKAQGVLSDPFGPALAEAVVRHSIAEEWSVVESLAPQLRRSLIWRRWTRRPCSTMRALAKDTARAVRRFLRPGGMTIVVLGADGSGKSTVGALAIEHLRQTFPPVKSLQIHWKPVVFFKQRRRPTGLPTVDPHGRPPRGRLASLFYLHVHWLEFFLGSMTQFQPVLFRGGLVLIDRYYYDFLVDQRRYRLQVPNWVVRGWFSMLRQPDLVFLLDAPAEVLQARKQEVPAAETARQVAAYRALVNKMPQGRVLDATQPADAVARELTRRVLEWLEQRTQER